MKGRIIVCDDDHGIVDVLETFLSSKGFEILGIIDEKNIYNDVKKFSPDLILLDLWMPYINGDEITKALKNNLETKSIPIIIISASKDTKTIANESGANDYLSKPFLFDELLKKIDKLINLEATPTLP